MEVWTERDEALRRTELVIIVPHEEYGSFEDLIEDVKLELKKSNDLVFKR